MRHFLLRRFMIDRFLPTALLMLLLALATGAQAAEAPPQERYDEARAAFEKGDFAKAQYLAESLVKEQHLAPALFQLLGNTRYRLGDLGRAALYYQRAAMFPPPSHETRQNLAHLHERTGNFYFPANNFRQQFASWLTRTQWLAIAVFCGWILTFSCLIAFFFLRAGNSRAVLLTIALLALTGEALSALGWFWHPSYEHVRELAVVTSKDARAYAAASTTSSSLVQLPPGSQVRKIEDRDSWCYVEFHDGSPLPEGRDLRGWVQSESLAPLWPYDPACLE
jgi:tetratricopeptide (TPR) repeat protein